MVEIRLITNFFEPLEGGEQHQHAAGITIREWLEYRYGAGFVEFEFPTICILNGDPILRAEWINQELDDDDVLCFVTVPTGLDPITVNIIIAVVSTIISVVLTFALAPPEQDPTQQPDDVYDLRGQRNQVKLGKMIEVPYGMVRLWPSYAALPYNSFKDNDQEQFQLFCFGQGEFDTPVIQIEDAPVDSFTGITTNVAGPEEPNVLFPNNVVTSALAVNLELLGWTDGSGNPEWVPAGATGYPTNPPFTQTDIIAVDISFPRGVRSTSGGDSDKHGIEVLFHYREIDDFGDPVDTGVGDNGWLELINFQRIRMEDYPEPGLITDNRLETSTPLRFTEQVVVTPGRYEVRGAKNQGESLNETTIDDTEWTALRGFLPSTQTFGGVTTLAVKATADAQLNDRSANKVNVLTTRKLPIWDVDLQAFTAPQVTRSPIWALVDIFRANYGGQLTEQFLNLDYLAEKAIALDAREIYFDHVFSTDTTVWKAAQVAMRVANSVPYLEGSVVSCLEDKLETVAAGMFSPDNVIKDSLSWEVKLPSWEDHDSIELTYTDADTWQEETILCLVGDDVGDKPKTVKMPGCTDRTRAYRLGLGIRAREKEQRENIKFSTEMDGQVPEYGSLIYVSHDVFGDWTVSGFATRIVNDPAFQATVIYLDAPVVFEEGEQHRIILRKKDGTAQGPYPVVEGDNEYEVRVTSPVDMEDLAYQDYYEPPIFHFGQVDQETKLCKVTGINPDGRMRVSVSCVNYTTLPYSFEEVIADPIGIPARPPEIPALPVVTGLKVVTDILELNTAIVSWQTALGATRYLLQTSSNGGDWSPQVEVPTTHYITPVPLDRYLYVRVAGVRSGAGPWAVWEGQVGVPTVVPIPPTNLRVEPAFTGLTARVIWDPLAYADSYQVTVATKGVDRYTATGLTSSEFTVSHSELLSLDPTGKFVARDITFKVAAVNVIGVGDPATVVASNPIPPQVTGLIDAVSTTSTNIRTIQLSWDAVVGLSDFDLYHVWVSETEGFTPGPGNLVYSDVGNSTLYDQVDTGTGFRPIFWRAAAKDVWGDETIPSEEEQYALAMSVGLPEDLLGVAADTALLI